MITMDTLRAVYGNPLTEYENAVATPIIGDGITPLAFADCAKLPTISRVNVLLHAPDLLSDDDWAALVNKWTNGAVPIWRDCSPIWAAAQLAVENGKGWPALLADVRELLARKASEVAL